MKAFSILIVMTIFPALLHAESPLDVFPEDTGREEVIANCTACHSHRLITQSHFSDTRWNEVIDWMQKKQGLWDLAPDTRHRIIRYLARHYGNKATDDGLYETTFTRPMFIE